MKFAKTAALVYLIYSVTTDVAIWSTALYLFLRQQGLTWHDFWRGGASSSATTIILVLLAPVYVQNLPLSSLFLTFGANKKNFTSLLRQQQCDDDFLQRCPRHYTRNGVACQVFFARMLQIVYNCTSLRNGDDNCRKLVQMCEKFLTLRPRARPPEIRWRFLHEERKNHLTPDAVADIMYA